MSESAVKSVKKAKSLAQQLRWQLTVIGLALFFAFMLLMVFYHLRSVLNAGDNLMQLEARSLILRLSRDSEAPLPRSGTLSAYRNWKNVPEVYRSQFTLSDIETGKVYERYISNEREFDKTRGGSEEQEEGRYIYLLHHQDPAVGELFLVSVYESQLLEMYGISLFKSAVIQSLAVSILIMLLLFGLIFWLLKKTSQPMRLLTEWAGQLRREERAGNIEFPIQELNVLASQLKEGVDKMAEVNMREQQFLKHASHEMRTPLAIMQACLDTLSYQIKGPERKTIERALKASDSLNILTTTLLWLARDSSKPVARSRINVNDLCERLIEEHQILLSGRNIDIHFQAHAPTLEIESDLLGIVMANLVRNACQYSSDGEISIEVFKDHLEIVNPTDAESSVGRSVGGGGFGLGLQLVERICDKLGWKFLYQAEQVPERVRVVVSWN
ncbi:sensor histidine kinase [Hahella ganghwensis]|uniref:sensor histidine kinase n=1 Tax=Hahella ganghwensis TaxID=286420 RepID=UPI000363CBB7|nr:HAMP domain-containing sensor histidine kinase [Hahella ganghwensis]